MSERGIELAGLEHIMSADEMKSFAHECLKQASVATEEGCFVAAAELLVTARVLLEASEGKEVVMRLTMNSPVAQ